MPDLIKIAPGVVRSFDGKRAIYTGTAEALVMAGLIEPHQLPGQPGMPRGICTIDAQGYPGGFSPGHGLAADRVGSKQIITKQRRGSSETLYEVRLVLSVDRAAAIAEVRKSPDFAGLRVPEALTLLGNTSERVWPFPASYGGQQMGVRA